VMYDLRHCAATVMKNAGVPYSAVAAILGHKRKDQTATYTHAQLSTMRRGVESLESWCQEIDGFFSSFDHQSTSAHITQQSAKA
jgi:site-specific recombinase XerD